MSGLSLSFQWYILAGILIFLSVCNLASKVLHLQLLLWYNIHSQLGLMKPLAFWDYANVIATGMGEEKLVF